MSSLPTILPLRFHRLTRSLARGITERIAAIHPGFSVISGLPGTGKTEIEKDIIASFNESTGKAALYLAFTMEASGYSCAQVLRLTHEIFLGPLTWRKRQQKPESLAQECVHRLQAQEGTQWLFLDEAGLLSHAGLNAIVGLHDAAVQFHHPLSPVLIGNDDLPLKMQRRPQVENRVKEWVYVEPYTQDQLHEVLPKLDGSLQSLSLEDLTRLSQFLHHTYQGNLRATRAYLERLHACWSPTQPLEQVLLQATADRVSRAKQKATEDALFQARSHRP